MNDWTEIHFRDGSVYFLGDEVAITVAPDKARFQGILTTIGPEFITLGTLGHLAENILSMEKVS